MQKALLQMNVQLSQALSDVMGETGQAIIRAIVAGERSPQLLAAFRDPNCKKSEEEIGKALTGTWREEHQWGGSEFGGWVWGIVGADGDNGSRVKCVGEVSDGKEFLFVAETGAEA